MKRNAKPTKPHRDKAKREQALKRRRIAFRSRAIRKAILASDLIAEAIINAVYAVTLKRKGVAGAAGNAISVRMLVRARKEIGRAVERLQFEQE